MLINATFLGKSSLGFETGNTYDIKVEQRLFYRVWTEKKTGAIIRSQMNPEDLGEYLIQIEAVSSRCCYSTSEKLMKNWKLNTFRDCTVGWNLNDYESEKNKILSTMRDSKLKILI